MDFVIEIDIVVLIVFFILAGFFSASESALMGLGRIRLARAIERGGARGKALESWKKDPNRLLTTILILNNSINIAASTVAAFLAFHISETYNFGRAQMATLVAVLVTFIIIVFGEVTPKILAIQMAEPIALFVIRPLVWIAQFFQPISRVLVGMASLLLRPFGIKPGGSVPMITEEEIRMLIQISADEGILEDQEHQMIHGVIQLSETTVREVMVPRTNMECINADDSMDMIIDQVVQAGYSRMPVYRERVDNIVGVIYAKDIISVLQNRELIVLQDILRQPYFVPETKRVDELLHDFQRGNLHLAIVVDEYGGTAGLVTMEDLMEEIVGDIKDEYDVEEKKIEKTGEGLWVVDAQATLDEIRETLETDLPDLAQVNTIGGFVSHLLGHLPKKGEQVVFRELHFTILAATNRKIEKIQIKILEIPVISEDESK